MWYIYTVKKNTPPPVKLRRVNPYLFVAAFGFTCYMIFVSYQSATKNNPDSSLSQNEIAESDTILARAFANHLSDVKVTGQGVVVKILPNDLEGVRHQRFIIALSTGQSILVAHNFDVGDWISGLAKGDTVQFSGQYVWNEQGGVIHNTHRDSKARHPGGWLKYRGKKYQ
jgi:hypothetical protein